MQIVHYLTHTQSLCIMYTTSGNQSRLIAYSDTDWAGDVETSRSTTGYAICLANRIVSWLSRKQWRVRLSSTEAEYCGMTECAKQIQWICNLFGEISIPISHIPLCIDNQSVIFLASNSIQEGWTKHVRIPQHYICEAVENGEVKLFYVPTNIQFADILIKNLGKTKFLEGCNSLTLILFPTWTGSVGIIDISYLILSSDLIISLISLRSYIFIICHMTFIWMTDEHCVTLGPR